MGLGLLAAAGLAAWWWLRPARPAAPARALVAGNPALGVPARPVGMVVLARPGGWARLLARDPARRLLLDPGWWRQLDRGGLRRRGAIAPAAAAIVLLDRFPRGVTAAWWEDGWVVQGAVGTGRATGLPGWLPERLRRRAVLRDGVLRLASDERRLVGWAWRPPEANRWASRKRLAVWAWIEGAVWTGRWQRDRLILERGVAHGGTLPQLTGTALLAAPNGATALAAMGVRLPHSGLLAGLAGRAGLLLQRPVTVWIDEVASAQPLPRPRLALQLAALDGRDPETLRTGLRAVLCPIGCRVDRRELCDGSPVERWQSLLGAWWFAVRGGTAVVATGHDQLERWLAGEAARAVPERTVVLSDGRRAAPALEALARTTLLADLGLVPGERLELVNSLAGPMRGIARIAYVGGADGERLEIDLAAASGVTPPPASPGSP